MNKGTILIVEDEVIVAADLANKVSRMGYQVIGSTTLGEEAIDLAREGRPDLVLMDICLAGAMDGVTAAELIRREYDLPVIFLTAHSDHPTLQRAKLSEPFGYILKPFKKLELENNIEMALYKHQADRKLRASEAALRKANEALLKMNETLESQVAERTAKLEQRTLQLRALAGQLTQAEEQERRRISQILHDELQQLLVGARLNLQYLSARYKDEPLRGTLLKIEGLIAESINTGRLLTAELSPRVLYQFGLGAALTWLGQWCGEKYGLRVEVEVEPEAREVAEEVQVALYQSIRELLFNVVKHAGVKSARLTLGCSQDGVIRLEVSDHGVGFDPQMVRAREGSAGGFGLFSLRERLQLFGAELAIESAPGHGSRFIITVPPADAALPADPSVPLTRPAPPDTAGSATPKIRLVLVDDHQVVRNGLECSLHNEPDLEVLGHATNGLQALELAHRLQPDVVLMDVDMPILDGIEATRRLRVELPHIKVIGMSMDDDHPRSPEMLHAGAVAFLDKNDTFAQLVATIRRHAGGQTGA